MRSPEQSRPQDPAGVAALAVGSAAAPAPARRLAFAGLRRRAWWRDSLRRRFLAVADVLAALAASLSLGFFPGGGVVAVGWSALFVPGWILLAKLHGLYDADHRAMRHLTVDELPRILLWATSGTAATSVFLSLTPAGGIGIPTAIGAWLVAAAGCFVLRSVARMLWRRVTPPERTLIVGTGALADAARRKIQLFPDMHLELVGEQREVSADDLGTGVGVLSHVDRVVLAVQAFDERLIADLLAVCRRRQIKLSVVPPIRGMFGTTVRLDHVADLPVVQYNTWDVSRSTLLLKRVLDVTFASVVLLALSPLLLLVAAAVRLDSRGPAIFAQRRAGLAGRPFRMFKFRTMVSNAEALLPDLVPFDRLSEPMFKLRDDPRVTRVGRFLRKTSLDELPQLLNVLKGEMSLVGPRPEQVDLVERYRPEERFRLAVKPGLTGPMQVFGRGQLTFEERLAVERDYIDNLSLGRDLRILALTFRAVVTGEGAF
jgi:exopolysaccharide biosynthesis polyprenyl glycosylphosphotransferase